MATHTIIHRLLYFCLIEFGVLPMNLKLEGVLACGFATHDSASTRASNTGRENV